MRTVDAPEEALSLVLLATAREADVAGTERIRVRVLQSSDVGRAGVPDLKLDVAMNVRKTHTEERADGIAVRVGSCSLLQVPVRSVFTPDELNAPRAVVVRDLIQAACCRARTARVRPYHAECVVVIRPKGEFCNEVAEHAEAAIELGNPQQILLDYFENKRPRVSLIMPLR